MSEVNPKEGVAITYPVGEITSSTSSFDEDVKARIKAMAETGWMPEGTEYFNRRVKDLIIQLMGRERTGTFIDVLGCVEKSNPKLALNIKYDALRGLESVNSGAEEAPAPEQTRYHILGSAAFQLIADSRLPESEQIFSAPDILQFFTNHFSFETRTHLAGILNLYGGLSNELQEVIRKEFGLPDFHNTSDPTGEDRQETKFSGNSAGRAPSALAEPEHMEHYDSSEMSLEEIQVQHTLRAICERIQSIAEINDAQIVQSTKRSDGVYCSLSEEIAKAMGWDKVEMVFSHPTRFTQGISTPRAGIACYSQQKETQQVDGDEYEVVNLKRTYVFNVMDDPNSANYGKHSVLIHDHEALGDGLGGLTSPDAKELENLWLSIEKATTEMLFRTVTKDFVVNESTKKVEELTKSVASKLDQINTPQEAHAIVVGLEANQEVVSLFNSYVKRWMANAIGAQMFGVAIEWYNHRINADIEPEFDHLLDLTYLQYLGLESQKILDDARDPSTDRGALAERFRKLLDWAKDAKLLSETGKKLFKERCETLNGFTTIFGLPLKETDEDGQ